MSRKALREAIDTYEELLRLHQLNLELLETLELSLLWLKSYTDKYDIPIPKRHIITSLLTKTSNLLNEIGSKTPYKTLRETGIRRFFTARKSDKDFTEP